MRNRKMNGRVAFSVAIFVMLAMTVNSQDKNEVRIKFGESHSIADSRVVEFVEIVEESRCPKGVDCIQAGRAVIRIRISGGAEGVNDLLFDTSRDNETMRACGITIRLINLEPYPEAETVVGEAQYVATFLFEKTTD